MKPLLVINTVPLCELEIFLKNYYFNKAEEQTIEQFSKNFSPEYKLKIKKLFEDYVESKKNIRQNCHVTTLKHMRYFPSMMYSHDFFEMIYLLSGDSCTVKTSRSNITLTKEDMLFLPPNTDHSVEIFNNSIVMSFLIHKNYFSSMYNNILKEKNVLSSFLMQGLYNKNDKSSLLFHTLGDNDIYHLIETILVENIMNSQFSNIMTEALLFAVINFLLRNHIDDVEYEGNLNELPQIISSIILYIQNNIKEVSLNSVAREFNYTPTYLSKLIKAKTNCTFSDIVQKERIQRACSLLINTNMSIENIAYEVGYETQRQFNRVFKSVTTSSPLSYRLNK